MKKVIVTGGRDYDDRAKIRDVLNFINPDMVIQGGASGADLLAKKWADANVKDLSTVEAQWAKYGKSAGPRRNREMLDLHPGALVLAFPGGIGTSDCIKAALERGHIVLQVK